MAKIISREEFRERLVQRLLVYGVLSDLDAKDVVSNIDDFIDKYEEEDMTMSEVDKLFREISEKMK